MEHVTFDEFFDFVKNEDADWYIPGLKEYFEGLNQDEIYIQDNFLGKLVFQFNKFENNLKKAVFDKFICYKKMMDEKEIMPYNFFKYGGVYTGEHHGMRYLIKNTGEKPDFKLMVQVWLGPYASTAVPDEKKTTQYFESSVEGRKEAINWLHEQYETRRGEWDTAPALLDAVLPQ